jgi:hypothetical protein
LIDQFPENHKEKEHMKTGASFQIITNTKDHRDT